jgi:flagellar hook protein FlgE
VTFEESLSQLLQGAARGVDGGGGTNPMQVGLGMNIGSIDTRLSQGNLESTGLITDLSIEGKAYFAVSDGNGTYYTRNGAF